MAFMAAQGKPTEELLDLLAKFAVIEQRLTCQDEEVLSKHASSQQQQQQHQRGVSLSNAVLHVNRYCAKLPSDAFTRLTPVHSVEKRKFNGVDVYVCSIQLPINCPLRETVVGPPAQTEAAAKRAAALETLRRLHR